MLRATAGGERNTRTVEGWPLAGRSNELRRPRTLVRDGSGAVIVGPAGVGKTALARACAGQAERDGIVVVRTTATNAARSLPLGAFAGLLPRDEVDASHPGGDDGLLRRYAVGLIASAGGGRPLVVVNDAHLLDDASATLVHQLAESRDAAFLLTLRTGDGPPDAIVALWKDGRGERIDLGLLGREEIGEVLTEVLEAPLDPAAARLLADRRGGNPLFLRELLVGGLEAGDPRLERGVQLVRSLRPSRRLTELIDLRVGRLEPAEADLLRLVATHEPVGTAELFEQSVPAAMEALERKAVVASVLNGRRLEVWLAHPLYGEVARESITALQRRELARRGAEVIERLGARRRDDMLVVATWRLAAGGRDPVVLQAGAAIARTRNVPALTAQLAGAAVDAGAGFEARFLAAEAPSCRDGPTTPTPSCMCCTAWRRPTRSRCGSPPSRPTPPCSCAGCPTWRRLMRPKPTCPTRSGVRSSCRAG